MIQTFHVHMNYGRGNTALTDVTLEIDRGEFVFLTGPSGAGKTTFLKLIFREEVPSQGQILVNGRNVSAIPEAKIPFLRRNIGVVFQGPADLTAHGWRIEGFYRFTGDAR